MEKPEYLMKQAFHNWNALKRFQTLEDIEKEKGNIDESKRVELLKYKSMLKMELSLRALQINISTNEE